MGEIRSREQNNVLLVIGSFNNVDHREEVWKWIVAGSE